MIISTLNKLARVQRAHDADLRMAEGSRKGRNRLIVVALNERVPQKQIMAVTGLSRSRLNQIKKGTR